MHLDSELEAWDLEDAEERQRNAPDLYSVPAIADRQCRAVGDRVQLLFRFRGRDKHGMFIQSERLPVVITKVVAGGYRGLLEFLPVSGVLLGKGDEIRFEWRHISSILS